MEFGIALDLPTGQQSLRSRLEDAASLARIAQDCGFSSVYLGGASSGRPESAHLPSPLVALGYLAGQCDLALGTGVILLPAWEPQRLAYDTAVLDDMCGGRLELGVGIGKADLWARRGVSAEGIGDWVDAFLVQLRDLWSRRGGDSSVAVSENLRGASPRVAGPPIWVGGRVARSARRAAQFGGGWYASTSYTASEVARMVKLYRRNCVELGKQSGAVMANRITVVAETRSATDGARRHVAALVESYSAAIRLPPVVDQDGHVPISEDRRTDAELLLVGGPDDVNGTLAGYAEAGVTNIQARVWPKGMPLETAERSIRLLGEHILPVWKN